MSEKKKKDELKTEEEPKTEEETTPEEEPKTEESRGGEADPRRGTERGGRSDTLKPRYQSRKIWGLVILGVIALAVLLRRTHLLGDDDDGKTERFLSRQSLQKLRPVPRRKPTRPSQASRRRLTKPTSKSRSQS